MDRQISDIFITSDFFGENVRLTGILAQDLNLVYGMNGSGKSTLARALRDYAAGVDENYENYETSGTSEADKAASGQSATSVSFNVPLEEWERRNIFVFNEEYLRKNIELIAEYVEGFRCYAVCHPELTL